MMFALVLAFQAGQATVSGDLRDSESGRPLVHASVHLTNLDRQVLTDAQGRYTLSNVPPGPQHLTFRLIGYTPRTLDALVPREGRLEISVTLRAHPLELAPLNVTATTGAGA